MTRESLNEAAFLLADPNRMLYSFANASIAVLLASSPS